MAYLRILWEELKPLGFKASYQIVLDNRIITVESKEFPKLPTPIAEINEYDSVSLYVPKKMGNQMIGDAFGFDHMHACVEYKEHDEHLPLMKDFEYTINDD
jgi:hypothetical protein